METEPIVLPAKLCFYKSHWTNHLLTNSAYGHVDIRFTDGSTITPCRFPEYNGWLPYPWGKEETSVDVVVTLDNIISALAEYREPLSIFDIRQRNCIRFASLALYGNSSQCPTVSSLLLSNGLKEPSKPLYVKVLRPLLFPLVYPLLCFIRLLRR